MYAWVSLGDGRQVYCKVKKERADNRSSFPCPTIKMDRIPPTRGMDGRMHTSLSTYRHSLTPEGNPYGQRYYEIGNESTKPYKAPEFNKQNRRTDIKRAINDVKNG